MEANSLNINRTTARKKGSSIQTLKALLAETNHLLDEIQLTPPSTARFRGDMLEISLDRSELGESEKNDSLLYIKTGLQIALLLNHIEAHGIKASIRTFPRFDEPDLMAFIYTDLKDSMAPAPNDKPIHLIHPSTATFEAMDGLFFKTLSNKSKSHSLGLRILESKGDKDQILSMLKNSGLPCLCAESDKGTASPFAASCIKHLFGGDENLNLIMISSRQDTPAFWLKSGMLLGDAMYSSFRDENYIYPLNLTKCSGTMQAQIRAVLGTNGNSFPQILLFAARVANSGDVNPDVSPLR